MESLAVVVAMLFLIAIFAGPISIGLSSEYLIDSFSGKFGFIFSVIRFFRKSLHLICVTLGTLVGVQFLMISGLPLFPRLVGLAAVVTSYIGLRREYFPELFLVRNLFARVGIQRKKDTPVYSADGTEIVRSKKSKRTGRTLGSDSHGPEGQH